MAPIYTKLSVSKRRKKAGAKQGHPGDRRKTPARIDQRKIHRWKQCPGCGDSCATAFGCAMGHTLKSRTDSMIRKPSNV